MSGEPMTPDRLARIRASIERVGAPGPTIELLAEVDRLAAERDEYKALALAAEGLAGRPTIAPFGHDGTPVDAPALAEGEGA